MPRPVPKYADKDTALGLVAELGHDFAVVENPQYVFPPYEVYPFASPRTQLDEGLRAAVMDMDGTTTTTEPLCLHSLETMVRRITNRMTPDTWEGLDHARDFPNIIGNSTTKHVEYLIRTYEGAIDVSAMRRAYVHAAAWTLGQAADPSRRRELRSNLLALGGRELLGNPDFEDLVATPDLDTADAQRAIEQLANDWSAPLALSTVPDRVRASVDIYYQRYHEILAAISAGQGDLVEEAVFGQKGGRLIAPMPGIGIFLALLKGWLGADAAGCHGMLSAHLGQRNEGARAKAEEECGALARLGRHFETQPAAVAVVTSSIEYEARIVLGEVFRMLASEVQSWPIPEQKRERIAQAFSEPFAFYDGFVTASDSSEIRLKPHRDLYSLALHQIGVLPSEFHRVVGFEDSESGAIAIRAAGIPLCCALPFSLTQGHSFQAATHTCKGGVPEVILRHHVFLAASNWGQSPVI